MAFTVSDFDDLVRRLERLEEMAEQILGKLTNAEIRLDRHEVLFTELQFERRAPSYFGQWLRRPRVVTLEEAGVDDAIDDGRITEAAYDQLRWVDLLVRGTSRVEPQVTVTLAIEVSATVDLEDVERAIVRARILDEAGIPARPAVAGHAITERAAGASERQGVYVNLAAVSN